MSFKQLSVDPASDPAEGFESNVQPHAVLPQVAADYSAASVDIDFRNEPGARPANWGSQYVPPFTRKSARDDFFRLVDQIENLSDKLTCDEDNLVVGEQEGLVAEIESLFEKLYECPWGEGEALKRIVLEVQLQIRQVKWDRRHVLFVSRVAKTLRARYLIDEPLVNEVYSWMEEYGLDPFRAVFS